MKVGHQAVKGAGALTLDKRRKSWVKPGAWGAQCSLQSWPGEERRAFLSSDLSSLPLSRPCSVLKFQSVNEVSVGAQESVKGPIRAVAESFPLFPHKRQAKGEWFKLLQQDLGSEEENLSEY